jgi:hypothetical protein
MWRSELKIFTKLWPTIILANKRIPELIARKQHVVCLRKKKQEEENGLAIKTTRRKTFFWDHNRFLFKKNTYNKSLIFKKK